MAQLADIIDYLESIAPLKYQESYDNSGLIIGDTKSEVKAVMISLDVTEEVLDEAIALGCNVIISHHPLIFRGIKKIEFGHYVGRCIKTALKNDLNIYAIHTNLDNVLSNGVNEKIAKVLELQSVEVLCKDEYVSTEGFIKGSGVIGNLSAPMEEIEFLHYLKDKMKASVIRHTKLLSKNISKVAVCGGSGSFLLGEAINNSADIFISGDFKYHDFFEANKEILIADIGHFESEQFTIDLLFELITNNFSNFAAHCAKLSTNPIHYFK